MPITASAFSESSAGASKAETSETRKGSRRWLRDYKRLEGTRLKQLRARMRADKVKLKEITAAVRPQKEALRNEATLFARYWQQRRARHERYHELRNEAFVSACLRSKRAPEDVQLPPDWQPDEILEPYTPWQMPARGEGTVRKVMRFYWEQKYGPSRPFDVALPGFYTEEDYQISSAEATEATEASGGDDDVNSVSSSSQSDDKEAPDDCTDPAIQQG